jgi:hypothetical protein
MNPWRRDLVSAPHGTRLCNSWLDLYQYVRHKVHADAAERIVDLPPTGRSAAATESS